MLRACARELAIVAVLILLTLAAPAEAGAQSAAESGRDAEARVAFDAGVSALQGGERRCPSTSATSTRMARRMSSS